MVNCSDYNSVQQCIRVTKRSVFVTEHLILKQVGLPIV